MRAGLALAGALLLLGLLVSRPLGQVWTDGVPVAAAPPVGGEILARASGDTLQLYYQLWLAADGLRGGSPLFRDPYQFRIDGPRWNLPQTFWPLSLPFAVLSPLGGPAAYNLLVLLSFPLAGLAAFGLVRRYTGDARAAAVAGVAYALLPARLEPLYGGQPAGFAAALAPVVLWGLDVALVEGRLAGSVLGGGALCAIAALEPHHAYIVGGLTLAYAVGRGRGQPAARSRGTALLAFALLAAAGAGWLWMLRQAFLVGSVVEAGRRIEEIRLAAPDPAAAWAAARYGGGLLLGLAAVGLLPAGGARPPPLRGFFAGALVTGAVLSLGPTLPAFPLYEALHRWAPLFGLIRNVDRFRLLASLGIAVLAGYGAAALLGRVPARAAPWAAAALAGAVAAGTGPWHAIAVARLPDSAVYAALRAGARRVLYLPVGPGDGAAASAYLHHVTRTRVPMLNGYSPLVARGWAAEVLAPLRPLNAGDLGPEEYARLHRLGITHLVLDRAQPDASPFSSALVRDRLRASPGLALEVVADPLWLFRLEPARPAAPAPVSSPVGLFHEAEHRPRGTGAVREDPAASGGRVVEARPGRDAPGLLSAGLAELLPAGAYRATVRARGHGLTLEAAREDGSIIVHWPLPETDAWEEHVRPLTVGEAAAIGVRLLWDGSGEAALDWTAVVFADRPEPEWTFEVEALPHRLVERPDPAASGGWAGYADPAESPAVDVVSGPRRRFPAGRYRLLVRARAEHAAVGPRLAVLVTESGGRVLARGTVDGAALSPGVYREAALPFTLARPTVVEFPIRYLGGPGVWLDRLGVVPD
jgi:hypothetical protein